MDFRWLRQGASAAARMRSRGETWAGHPLWTGEEIAELRKFHPGYKGIEEALSRRSYVAIRLKARSLGLKTKHHWTEAEKLRFRQLYRTGGISRDLLDAFPHASKANLKWIAKYYRCRRDPRPPKLSGFPLIDEIRHRAFELGYTMVDLDLIAGTGQFFQGLHWTISSENHRAIGRGVRALGGHFYAEWPETQAETPVTDGRMP